MSKKLRENIAHPSPGHYDYNTGGGYGKSQGSNSFLGGNYNFGDALSKHMKTDFDKENDEEIVRKYGEDLDDEDIGIDYKVHSRIKTNIGGTDANHKAKRNPNSFVGLANTSAYLGIHSSYNPKGNVITEMLSEYIREVLYESMSGSLYASNLGNHYRASGHNMPGGKITTGKKLTHASVGVKGKIGKVGDIDRSGYGNKATVKGDKYAPEATMFDEEIPFDEIYDKEDFDQLNVLKHQKQKSK